MQTILEFLKKVHNDAVKWCRGRMWYVRLPLLVYFVWILVNHMLDDQYNSLFGALNLGIHELGHPLFSYFGEFMHAAGGTILQCAAPVISVFMFYRLPDYFAISVCFGWLSTNFYGVATYVADARAHKLPLVTPGGGVAKHDWTYLLSELGMLESDLTLAFLLRIAAFILMMICFAAGGYLLWRMYKPLPEEPEPTEYRSRIE